MLLSESWLKEKTPHTLLTATDIYLSIVQFRHSTIPPELGWRVFADMNYNIMTGGSIYVVGDTFDPDKSHPAIELDDAGLFAMFPLRFGDGLNWSTVCLLGSNRYRTGQHDLFVDLDDLEGVRFVSVGMTSNTGPSLHHPLHAPGHSAWYCGYPGNEDSRDKLFDGNVGQPWITGDVIHLHLDCERHTLFAWHERTGKTQSIRNVTGTQRLFISYGWENFNPSLGQIA